MRLHRLSTLLISAFIANSLSAGAASLRIHVSLRPLGSFNADTTKVEGHAEKNAQGGGAHGISVNLDDLDSGVELRNEHMKRRYFETAKFPKAVLKEATARDGKFEGQLEVHGQTKPITGSYEVEGSEVHARFMTKMSDFGIGPASYMGVGAKDEVEVEVSLPVEAAATAPKN